MRMHVCVCIDEAKTVSLRTGRAGDIFGQMGRRGDNAPLAMGRRYGHPTHTTDLFYLYIHIHVHIHIHIEFYE